MLKFLENVLVVSQIMNIRLFPVFSLLPVFKLHKGNYKSVLVCLFTWRSYKQLDISTAHNL